MTDRDELAAIKALITSGDDRAAFARVRARLGWPRGKELTDVAAWLEVLGHLAAGRGAGELADVAAAAVRDPDSPDHLYDLGYALIDAGAPSIAASVLWRCLSLVGDSEEVVCELVSALESALAYNDAFAILEQHASLRNRSFLCEYLYAFNAAMTGRLDTTRTVLARLTPDSPETESMKATITAITERADRIAGVSSLDERDLRGWQYVLTGTLVAHQSPYGFEQPMHGRYAWLQDSIGRVATGIARLAPLVRALHVPCVYAPPGRNHEILARAVSRMVDLPIAPWPAVGVPAPGLVVVYDLAELPAQDIQRLQQRKPDQIVYAHASPWTQDFPIAPDVTTVLYQIIAAPWDGERTVEDVVAEIASSPGLDTEETSADDVTRWATLCEKAWPPLPGQRARLWAGGPVPSNRFE
ncbi:MAG TPA: hypothetical protein VFV99_10580 [Kofleriaceae bacterium]|nr:hypothetical protein [Kofleriaceae bacterium]